MNLISEVWATGFLIHTGLKKTQTAHRLNSNAKYLTH